MVEEKSPDALRTIGEVADELGVASHVLRFWESKFQQIKPQKRRGRRYYRPEDIRIITQIKALLYGQGYTIRGVQKFLAEGRHHVQQSNDNNSTDKTVEFHHRDLFGNIIKEETEAKHETAEDLDFFSEDIQTLKHIHQGLCAMRDKLLKVS